MQQCLADHVYMQQLALLSIKSSEAGMRQERFAGGTFSDHVIPKHLWMD